MWRILNGVVLLFVVALIGAMGFPRFSAGQRYKLQKGQSFWVGADEEVKTAYLQGYLDAESIYRSNMDLKLKPLCTTSGQKWIDDFDYTFPLLDVRMPRV